MHILIELSFNSKNWNGNGEWFEKLNTNYSILYPKRIFWIILEEEP